MPRHKFFHAVERFFDLAVFRCITGPDETASPWTKRIPWYHCDMFFEEQFFRKALIIHTGGLNVGKGIECAARLEGPQAEAIQSGNS